MVVDSDQGNGKTVHAPRQDIWLSSLTLSSLLVLSHIIAQLRPGADLSRITLPTFILENRSMLERITKYVGKPEMFLFVRICTEFCDQK